MGQILWGRGHMLRGRGPRYCGDGSEWVQIIGPVYSSLLYFFHGRLLVYCMAVVNSAVLLFVELVCNQELDGSTPGLALQRSNLRQIVHTYVPLLAGSVTW